METVEALKLNLGSRKTRLPGFKNFDIRPNMDVDFVGDARDLSQFATGSVAEVRASNILEHFPHVWTLEVLKEWNRVIEPGGKLWLSVPDFDHVIRLYNKLGRMDDWLIYHLYGEQGYDQQYHYICFTWPNLRALLDQAGFSKAKRVTDLPGGVKDASSLRDSIFNEPVSLNIEATK